MSDYATPPLKWPGGKRKLMPQLAPLIPGAHTIRSYVEPFVGGGAMLFQVANAWPHAYQKLYCWTINDSNKDLMSFYEALSDDPCAVADIALRFAGKHSAHTYSQARATFRTLQRFAGDRALMDSSMRALHAGLFLYLNKCGFNGLYRVNERGEFNVPCNKAAKWRPSMGELSHELTQAGHVLNFCMKTSASAIAVIDDAVLHPPRNVDAEEVFVFCDPPYLNEEQSSFTAYTPGKWGATDLMTLSLALKRAHEAGVRFMLTHLDTELTRDLFDHPDYNVTELTSRFSVSASAEGRSAVREIAVRNYT